MRISLKWLRELVDFELSPEELAEALTLVGFEVEEIEDRRSWAEGVVLGKILAAEPHPNADKLRVCQVDLGSEQPATIVCGAANARAGLLVPVATPGTHLPAVNLTIAKAEKRGVISEGMICSLAELGLERVSEGIHEFPPDLDLNLYPLGSDARPLLGLDDVVLDLTSTANRADALSMVGIAREVAALTRNPLRLPPVQPLQAKPIPNFKLRIADAKACPAYSGVLIEGVKVGPSPDWLKHRLAAAGMRSINNVVDVTNLILLEWGQPLHAFDWDRLLQIMGRKKPTIEVRFAQAGETLKTLDGQTRTLHPESHLIVAGGQPVALAGVMGGEETEVSSATTSIFLEAALFDPVVTRRSARSQGLRTEASARYERGVNFATLDLARDRAVQLILGLAGGSVVGLTTFDQRPPLERTLKLRLSRLIDVLGEEVRPEEVEEILSALGFQLSRCQKVAPEAPSLPATETASVACCVWQVTVPPYRLRDVEREIDLIEEFARLYGYDRFSETLPTEPQVGSLSARETLTRQIREVMRGIGLTEVYHISLCPAEEDSSLVKIANPLSPEYSAVRKALLPGLVEAFRFNWDQGNGPLQAFEIGHVFAYAPPSSPEPYQEAEHLGGILGGDPNPNDWRHHNRPMDWFEAKGLLVSALERLGFAPEFRPDPPEAQSRLLHPGRQAGIWIEGSRTGIFGQLHPRLCQEKDLPDEVYGFELELDPLLASLERRGLVRFSPFSPFPASDRDIAFFAPLELSVAEIEKVIRQAAGPLLQSVQLFDEYRGQSVPPGQRSLAFRLVYRAPDRTLTDAEVEAAQNQVRAQLEKHFPVTLRS
ncbi:phenylalanine--tRNA ligase subunit beta [Synechococcus sp. H60.1]|uniref:phenylalanine--tRNA ligase subunit beta n=1 Tax=Synechococcus sp. H60.1 TaxID=2964517 RepID=UPI0039C09509